MRLCLDQKHQMITDKKNSFLRNFHMSWTAKYFAKERLLWLIGFDRKPFCIEYGYGSQT